ncbi:hypothetical protein [Actinokineospora alba]|uniref:hypothetical protein n=1 Tax=Actinokineospora alba TaxID=504798 RepID=UPI000B809436|nr:hypothetical protein [Actinokineospora alba]
MSTEDESGASEPDCGSADATSGSPRTVQSKSPVELLSLVSVTLQVRGLPVPYEQLASVEIAY